MTFIKSFKALADAELIGLQTPRIVDAYHALRRHHEQETTVLLYELDWALMIIDALRRHHAPVISDENNRTLDNTLKALRKIASYMGPCSECGHSRDEHRMDNNFTMFCDGGDDYCSCGENWGR